MGYDDIEKSIIQQGDAKATRNILKGFLVTFLVYFLACILNWLNIFIVDSKIMRMGLIGMIVFLLIIFIVCKFMSYESPKTKYVVMFISIMMWSYLIMIMTYHALLIILFPLICSLEYRNKAMVVYTYVLTMIGIALATILGFLFGICDGNMLLLTYGTTATHFQLLQEGNITLNQNLFLVFLYFVVPRWMVITAFVPVANSLVRDIEERVFQEAAAKRRASIDDMTGAFNRNKYHAMLADYYPKVEQVSVIFWDVNNLKGINDEYGHEYGDQLIASVSESILKFQDDKKKVYRIGGDEFLLIGENLAAGDVERIVSDWKKDIDGKTIEDGIKVSAAVGYAEGTGLEIEQVIKQADENMYSNKKNMR